MLRAAATGLLRVSSSTILVSQIFRCFPLQQPTRTETHNTLFNMAGGKKEVNKKTERKYGLWRTWPIGGLVFVCPRVVKFDLIIHVEAVTLLPKLANETPSCQGTRTGHSDQLLNENDQVSNAALAAAALQIPAVLQRSYKTECTPAFFQWLGKVCHRCSL